ncbi:MAG TPA: DUF1259 domain-containing protein [Gemmatimonadaceae bacterium]|nr:DUF1259 domain-containing protein [Gemmatimonadaceae bacterium]
MQISRLVCTLALIVGPAVRVAAQQAPDWKAVDAAMGRAGALQPDGTYRFAFPRSDMHVTVDGLAIKPALALGGWIAFKAMPGGTLAMGDLVLADTEVTPVIKKLQAGNVEQTAIHHHLIRESPRVLYVHVHAHGDAVAIATTIRNALATTRVPAAAPAAPPAAIDLDTALVAKTLGASGKVNGGVYQVSVPRAAPIRDNGMEVPPSMGISTAINFQPTGNGKAAITGDFVMTAAEVNSVIKVLQDNGIETTSLHSHLLMEEPRLFFMHFWANDDAVKLARGLRAALDKTASKR